MLVRTIAVAAIASCIATFAVAADLSTPPAASDGTAHSAAAPLSVSSNYVIGPLDTLNIEVFGVPELSSTAQVDSSGNVPVALLGQLHAAGRTTGELSHEIATALDRRYVKHPLVTVTVKDAASQKITVDGEVTAPGVYQITPKTTLTEAVAMAKGPDQVADTGHVAIVRNTDAGRTVQVYDLSDIHDGKVPDPYVRANDEVVVDVSGTRRFVRDFSGAFSLLWLFHP